jgi:hypothetical protein
MKPTAAAPSTSVGESTDFVLPPIVEPEAVEALDATPPVTPPTPPVSIAEPQTGKLDSADNEPDGFMIWLREGLQAGTFEINTPDAFLHVVPEGLLMVSPRVFKKYIGVDGNWHHIQNRFFRGRFHRRNTDRTNIICYKVEGKRRSSVIKGVLIPDPQRTLGTDLPDPNKHLALQTTL